MLLGSNFSFASQKCKGHIFASFPAEAMAEKARLDKAFVNAGDEGVILQAKAGEYFVVNLRIAQKSETIKNPTDLCTRLIWEKTAVDKQFRWEPAKDYCAKLNMANSQSWHLPTKVELESLIDKTKRNPAWNGIFGGRQGRSDFWSSSARVELELAHHLMRFKWSSL